MDNSAPLSPKQPLPAAALSEKDLFRQIAGNLTKEHLSKDKANLDHSEDTKQIFAQNLQLVRNTWHAFEKHLYDQVVNKARVVDT